MRNLLAQCLFSRAQLMFWFINSGKGWAVSLLTEKHAPTFFVILSEKKSFGTGMPTKTMVNTAVGYLVAWAKAYFHEETDV